MTQFAQWDTGSGSDGGEATRVMYSTLFVLLLFVLSIILGVIGFVYSYRSLKLISLVFLLMVIGYIVLLGFMLEGM